MLILSNSKPKLGDVPVPGNAPFELAGNEAHNLPLAIRAWQLQQS